MSAFPSLEERIERAPPDDIPDLIGELARLAAIAQLRLASATPEPVANGGPPQMLTTAEVAERLGMSKKWVYAHKEELGANRPGGRAVRFPESKIARYLKASRRPR